MSLNDRISTAQLFALPIVAAIVVSLFLVSSCTVKTNGQWTSEHTQLELHFGDAWELILPLVDTERQTLVGITDPIDHCSIVVKISEDLPKDQLSDEIYLSAIKEKMLDASSENRLLLEEVIEFKGQSFFRLTFAVTTKFGDMISSTYVHRDSEKVKGIQLSYPVHLAKTTKQEPPQKIKKILKQLKI